MGGGGDSTWRSAVLAAYSTWHSTWHMRPPPLVGARAVATVHAHGIVSCALGRLAEHRVSGSRSPHAQARARPRAALAASASARGVAASSARAPPDSQLRRRCLYTRRSVPRADRSASLGRTPQSISSAAPGGGTARAPLRRPGGRTAEARSDEVKAQGHRICCPPASPCVPGLLIKLRRV